MADQQADYQDSGANGDQYAEQPDQNNGDQFADGNDGDKINATRNSNDENRKIFVGGLSWETTVKDMREYFEKFGGIEDCTLKTDAQSGRSRGFGFVQFKDATTVDNVLAQNTHTLHGRNIDPKRAKARGGREPIKKVFVGGLDPEVPEVDIKGHFEQFGKIEEIDLPFDKQKNQRRAFCFITFESEEIVDQVVASTKQTLNGKEVDVKKATPKNDQFGGGYGNYGPRRGGFRGGRGGRGGYNQGWGNDYYNNYNNYYGGYGGGYDYYNSGYGGYDYNNYYGQGGGWGGQSGSSGYGGYGGNYGGNQQGQNSQQYKQKSTRGGGQQSSGYHPYQR